MNGLRLAAALIVVLGAVAASTGCATTPSASSAGGSGGWGSSAPAPPQGEVTAQGTVLDDSAGVRLCLGAVAESFPPQCSGVPVAGWSWDAVDGSETASGTTWGAYAVQGRWDGELFALSEAPVPLALFDPAPFPDPTGGEPGTADEATLERVAASVADTLGSDALVTWPEGGRLRVSVVWDDGSWQRAADAEHGVGTVVIQPVFRPVVSPGAR